MIEPKPMYIRSIRAQAGLTQAQAGEMVGHGADARAIWSAYESGTATISAAEWQLFLIKTGNDDMYKPVPGNHVPTKADTSPSGLLAHSVNSHPPRPGGLMYSSQNRARLKNRP